MLWVLMVLIVGSYEAVLISRSSPKVFPVCAILITSMFRAYIHGPSSGEVSGMEGVDLSFYKNRALYHTPKDTIPGAGRSEARKSLWAMLEAARGAGLSLLNDDQPKNDKVPGVYFDGSSVLSLHNDSGAPSAEVGYVFSSTRETPNCVLASWSHLHQHHFPHPWSHILSCTVGIYLDLPEGSIKYVSFNCSRVGI